MTQLHEIEQMALLEIDKSSNVRPGPFLKWAGGKTQLLKQFECAVGELDLTEPAWGIVGAIYYQGFHNYGFDTSEKFLERTHHCLSGCTVYKRELIRKYPFRYDPENLGPFPDAFICFDAGSEFSFWNDHRIQCDHLHINGARMSRSL